MEDTRMYIREIIALMIALFVAGCATFIGLGAGRSSVMASLEQQQLTQIDLGKARFAYDDFGHISGQTLETTALPWKLIVAVLILYESDHEGAPANLDTLRSILQRYGFVYPARIGNWTTAPLNNTYPLGLITGHVSNKLAGIRIEVANFSCAACHAGRTFDAEGEPTDTAWLGLPNSSVDFDQFADAIYRGFHYALANESKLVEIILRLYPEIDEKEMRALSKFVIPRTRERFKLLADSIGRAVPYEQGGPGVTNGFAALKLRLGIAQPHRYMNDFSFVSIPELGGTVLRSSLLSDGIYYKPGQEQFESLEEVDATSEHVQALAEIVAFFTTPSQGGTPRSAVRAIPAMIETFAFLQAYEAPAFPGPINMALAKRGQAVYEANCSGCHGQYSRIPKHPRLLSFPNWAVPIEEIGTDPTRINEVSLASLEAIRNSAVHPYISVKSTGAYVATPLSGLWATSPYLHNGSVPTLWHLMHPSDRPVQFQVGGHRLNFEQLGIDGFTDANGVYRYPEGYVPWSQPAIFNTQHPGRFNGGHEYPFDVMSESDKRTLLEFLKLL